MIPESIDDLSVIATNNVPQGGDNVGGTLDDILRAHATIMKRDLALKKAETAEGTSFEPAANLLSKNVQEAIEEVADLVKSVDIGGYMKGMVVMWSGSVDKIPSGWALCNGSNGTPDLRGRFIIGAGGSYNPGNTGNGSIPSHSHGAGSLATSGAGAHTHTGTAASAGGHSHSASTNSAGAHTHEVTGTAASAGDHSHTYRIATRGGFGRYISTTTENYKATDANTSTAGAHTHSVSGTAASAGDHSHTVSVASGGAHTHTVSVTSAGAHTHTISGSTAAAGSGSEVIAKYYALCFIMKL
ncbi:phage tail protein [Oligella urethralis]|uniref:Phage tail fibre repeat n=1 Tax=Oligella urethralis TaxID=90245 RepID=A0A2X1ULZ5_9BURK|nr:phage tail protein [Oligella urethralis]SPY08179.1 Phage tail fibre repeat [Oligella urethralis]